MRVDGARAGKSGRETRSICKTAPLKPKNGLSGPPVLAYFPDFSADRNIHLGERLAEAKAHRPITGAEQVDANKPSLDDRAIGSSQFEVIARFQACLVSHCKRHPRSKVKRSVLKLEYVGNNDE